MLEKEELPLGLRDGLSPEVEQEGVDGATENTDEMVFPRLEGLFGNVATMVIGRY